MTRHGGYDGSKEIKMQYRFVSPSVSRIHEIHPYKRVEQIARVCYKSEDKITDNSWRSFCKLLIDRKHYAMLEHGVCHFWVKNWLSVKVANVPGIVVSCVDDDYLVTVSLSHLYNPQYAHIKLFGEFRAAVEAHYEISDTPEPYFDFLPALDMIAPDIHDAELFIDLLRRHCHISIKFVCDRGVSHELVRHRCAAAQESTRYCNYTADKFNNAISVILPSTADDWDSTSRSEFLCAVETSAQSYSHMIESGLTPQQARCVLPNALKTEVVLSMSYDRWQHFLDLRSRGVTGSPHPDMKFLADQIEELLSPIC